MADITITEPTLRFPYQLKYMDLGDGSYAICSYSWMKQSSYKNISTGTTTLVKGSPGTLQRIIMNKPLIGGVITIYDNTAGSGTKIGTITLPVLTLTEDVWCIDYGCAFTTGLTIVTGNAMDVTVIYN